MKYLLIALGIAAMMAAPARSCPVPESPPGQKTEQHNAFNLEKKTASAPTDQLAAVPIEKISAPMDNLATPIRTDFPSSMRADSGPPIAPMERPAELRYSLNKVNDKVSFQVNRWTWAGRTNQVHRLRC